MGGPGTLSRVRTGVQAVEFKEPAGGYFSNLAVVGTAWRLPPCTGQTPALNFPGRPHLSEHPTLPRALLFFPRSHPRLLTVPLSHFPLKDASAPEESLSLQNVISRCLFLLGMPLTSLFTRRQPSLLGRAASLVLGSV